MVRVQSFLILLLLVCVAEEFNHNQYFQEWATGNLGMFGFLLGGTLSAFYSGILIAVYPNQPLLPETRQKAKKREPVIVSPETQ
jgi:formate-dependent nitrite reductase membrane component NrfD